MSKTIDVDTKTFVRFWLVILGFGLAALFVWKAWEALVIIGIAVFGYCNPSASTKNQSSN